MIVRIDGLLDAEQVRHCRSVLEAGAWVDGQETAGEQSSLAKRNLQLSESAPETRALGELILGQLSRSATFVSAALPARVIPPLFNRYDAGMDFGAHIDNAMRHSAISGARYRTDLSCTLFLSDPADYDGGELVVEGQAIKLPAGDLALYPATTVHRVAPVTRGIRWASFFWVQSMVKDGGQRDLLHGMDKAIAATRADLGDAHPAVISLTGAYHNLIRMWSEI